MRVKTKKWVVLSLFLLSLVSLQGCVNATVSSAQAVYNRQNIQKTMNDQYITMQASHTLYDDTDRFKHTNISIATFNRVVLLTGQVPEPWQRAAVGKIVKNIPNVEEIYNQLTIAQPSSSLTTASDTWITTKIKSQFILSEDIDPSQIKVVTENGTVYLMGMIFPSQAKEAIEIARTTDGVQNVVKIFTYLKMSKTM